MNTTQKKVITLSLLGIIILILFLSTPIYMAPPGDDLDLAMGDTGTEKISEDSLSPIIYAFLFLLAILAVSIVSSVAILWVVRKAGFEAAGTLSFKGLGLDTKAGGVVSVMMLCCVQPLIWFKLFMDILPIFKP